MARRPKTPTIDRRRASDLLERLRKAAPFYTPEWTATQDDDPGVALLDVFSVIAEGVIEQLNRAPDKNFIEFLNMLGVQRLPARPARVPVQFKVNPGLDTPVLIPARTRCTAPATGERAIDLPFETLEDLWAVPSKLVDVVSVHPRRDAVFKPPQKFLELEEAARALPVYTTASLTAEGGKFFQLDRTDDLAAGDLLRVDFDDGDPSHRFLEVADKPEGTIVHLVDPIPREIKEGETVVRVNDYAVFDSKNLQEHILYIGHPELLDVKGPASLVVHFERMSEPGPGPDLHTIKWEYATEPDEGKGVQWREFDAVVDNTDGLSSDGSTSLDKTRDEPIVETTINGIESRWIRARVKGKIPLGSNLTELDLVTFEVASASAPVAPKYLFFNETPLEAPLRPFGSEPRQSDRFYIGSEEAFSKKKATIGLRLTLADEPVFSAVAATALGQQESAFLVTRMPSGQLAILEGQNAELDPLPPLDLAKVARYGSPAVVVLGSDRVVVFVRGDDGSLYQLIRDAQGPSWQPALDLPTGVERVIYDPTVIGYRTQNAGRAWLFVVDEQLRLHRTELDWNTARPGQWDLLGSPSNGIHSVPTMVVLPNEEPRVYVSDGNGEIYEWEVTTSWQALPTHPAVGEDPERGSRQNGEHVADRLSVFGQRGIPGIPMPVGTAVATVLVYRDEQDELQQLRRAADNVAWGPADPLGSPSSSVSVESTPTGIFLDPARDIGRHLFVRASDAQLWSMTEAGWRLHAHPQQTPLRGPPTFLLHSEIGAQNRTRIYSVFIPAEGKRLAELRGRFEDGDVEAGPERVIHLHALQATPAATIQPADLTTDANGNSDLDGFSVWVQGQNDDLARSVAAYDAESGVATLDGADPAWNPAPTGNLRIFDRAGTKADSGVVQGQTANTLKLENTSTATLGQFVVADGQTRRITSDPNANDVVNVSPAWDTPPANGFAYDVFDVLYEGTVGPRTQSTVVLEDRDYPDDHFVPGEIGIRTSDPQEPIEVYRVLRYFGPARLAIVDTAFVTPPAATMPYQIVGPLSQLPPGGWHGFAISAQEIRPDLSWEYFNGRGWLALDVTRDETGDLLTSGEVQFSIPDGIEKTEVAGQESFWVRARLAAGDYGREVHKVETKLLEPPDPNKGSESVVVTERKGIDPPVLSSVSITYALPRSEPQQCLTLNGLSFVDQTAAATTPDRGFRPFLIGEDEAETIYLGFEKPIEGSPIRVFFAGDELNTDERCLPRMTWTYRKDNDWHDLAVLDGTEALTKQGLLTLQVPENFQLHSLFGSSRYWIRGTLARGEYLSNSLPILKGVFPNACDAVQAATVEGEVLGSSSGEGHQEFSFVPVQTDEPLDAWSLIGNPEIRVLEALSPEEDAALVAEFGEEAVKRLAVLGEAQTWVLWTRVDHFFESSASSRHYQLDASNGVVLFGDGKRGMIPPVGVDNVQAFLYRHGGGAAGNVGAGEVNTLVTAVSGIEGAVNPVEAGGGGDRAPVEEMLAIGPAQISHRRRAVTAEDFEWLAKDASRQVVRARCRPNFRAVPTSASEDLGSERPGWVTVYILPESRDDQPVPSFELQRSVRRRLRNAADASLAGGDRIVVRGPSYVEVRVTAKVFATSIDRVGMVQLEVDQALRDFLHPLRGGPDMRGWEFGRAVGASDIFALLEPITHLDHVEGLQLAHRRSGADGFTSAPVGLIEVAPHEIVAWSDPEIDMDSEESGR